MGKLLFWILVGVVIFGVARFMSLMQRKDAMARQAAEERALEHEAMLRCDRCGVYFPAGEAVRSGSRVYCCPEHKAGG